MVYRYPLINNFISERDIYGLQVLSSSNIIVPLTLQFMELILCLSCIHLITRNSLPFYIRFVALNNAYQF